MRELQRQHPAAVGAAAWYRIPSLVDALVPSVEQIDAAYFVLEDMHSKVRRVCRGAAYQSQPGSLTVEREVSLRVQQLDAAYTVLEDCTPKVCGFDWLVLDMRRHTVHCGEVVAQKHCERKRTFWRSQAGEEQVTQTAQIETVCM